MAWPRLFRALRLLFPPCSSRRLMVLLLTFTSYALYHASRRTFSNLKVSIVNQWSPLDSHVSPNATYFCRITTQAILLWGRLDAIFLFSYVMGIFINDIIGEWISLRLVMAIGMCSSALVTFSFSTLTELPYFYNEWFYSCLRVLNGLCESTGWPCAVAIMSNWLGVTGQGLVSVLWSACASLGNVLGACLASLLLQYGYEYTFLVTASMQLAAGLIIIFTLWLLPKELTLIDTEDGNGSEEDLDSQLMNSENNEIQELEETEYYDFYEVGGEGDDISLEPIAFFEASSFPGVFLHFVAYASMKLLNYSYLFWLPLYLSNSFGWGESQVSQLWLWYDVEAIVGGAFHSFLTNLVQKRSMFAVCVLLATGSLVGCSHVPKIKAVDALLTSITVFFTGAPSDVTGSAISSDLGCQEQRQGSGEAWTTHTGIVDRLVSMHTVVGQYLVFLIQDKLGQMWVFYFLAFIAGCTILFISILLLLREIRDFVQKKDNPDI